MLLQSRKVAGNRYLLFYKTLISYGGLLATVDQFNNGTGLNKQKIRHSEKRYRGYGRSIVADSAAQIHFLTVLARFASVIRSGRRTLKQALFQSVSRSLRLAGTYPSI